MASTSRFLNWILGWIGAWLVRLWIGSLRIESATEPPSIDPLSKGWAGGTIFTCWHDGLLLPVYLYRNCRPHTLISRSKDGEYLARILERLGWQIVRGSSSRGGVAATLEMCRLGTSGVAGCFAIVADGPRGPRHVCKNGPIYIAAKTGFPLVPAGIAFERPWRARSWDRFCLPRPFSRACIVLGPPITISSDVSDRDLEDYRMRIEKEMCRLEAKAVEALGGEVDASVIEEGIRKAA